jgi:threonine aldolase
MKIIDLRSDTVTTPTEHMREAMARAEVGDDVYHEDPTANRLQELAAARLGKEAALFVPSGTMGNQICVKLHTEPGQEVILEERSHMYNLEMAGMAAMSGVLAHPVIPDGTANWQTFEPAIGPRSNHFAQTGLIALENSLNLAGGTVMPLDAMNDICERAHGIGIPVHLDGARIFNAATWLGCDVREIARPFDSIMFCLSKGLGAPVGSMIAGPREFIERAIPIRRMFGGAMRQVGILAAAGIVALETGPQRLAEDHANARLLAAALDSIPGIKIDPERVQTNILVFDISATGMKSSDLLSRLTRRGVLANQINPRLVRFVTHKDVTRQDCEAALVQVRAVVGEA